MFIIYIFHYGLLSYELAYELVYEFISFLYLSIIYYIEYYYKFKSGKCSKIYFFLILYLFVELRYYFN